MYVSEVLEPSRLDKAYHDEVNLGSVFGALAIGSCRAGLIILGNMLIGLAFFLAWKLAKKSYRGFTGHEGHTTGGVIALSVFGTLATVEWMLLELVNCQADHLQKTYQWQDSTRRFLTRSVNAILPLLVVYYTVTRVYKWKAVKKTVGRDERKGISGAFVTGTVLLATANIELYVAEHSDQYYKSTVAQVVADVAVFVMIAMAAKFYFGWVRALQKLSEQQFAFSYYNDSNKH